MTGTEMRKDAEKKRNERNVVGLIALRKRYLQITSCNRCGFGVDDGHKVGTYKWEPFGSLVWVAFFRE